MSPVASPQVLIVGAGPAGLTLALALVQQDIQVRIIEKQTSLPSGRRCAIIAPRTMEMLHLLGVSKAVEKLATGPFPVTRYKLPGGIEPLRTWMMAKPEKPTSDRPYVSSVYLGQDQLEEVLRDELDKYSCPVESGSELVSLTQDDDYVEAVIRKTSDSGSALDILDVPFLVGADGLTSESDIYSVIILIHDDAGTTRGQLEIEALDGTRDEEFITADVKLEGLRDDTIHMWSVEGPSSVTILAWPASGDLFTIQIAGNIPDRGRLITDEGFLEQYFVQQTNRKDIKFQEILFLSEYNPRIGMLEKFSQERVFLVGDAAHVHTLSGGQGMNSGIQDSMNLSWKLARVIKGQAHPHILETYNEERLPVVADMLNKLPELRLSGTVNEANARAFESAGLGVQQHNKSTDQMDVNYRWSSIVQGANINTSDGTDTVGLSAGDRAPDATKLMNEGGIHSLFDVFSCSRDTIVAFQPSSEGFKQIQRLLFSISHGQDKPHLISIFPKDAEVPQDHPSDIIFSDTENHALTAYEVPGGAERTFVIRPDGVVGAIAEDAQGLQEYYARLPQMS
ncbi:hypothetical protein D9619_008076 [Psilocybe cf. subviscida]|uniref:FAD-binding domain-containing protein n=1 Tax=Psilocybe cf. subviscida TaxID=2480587 RepID=A0A8H5EST4_9AGAR|nr:hypothetical protein D9619_008076 [Psilocybe cf. subviscida]